MTDIPRRIYGPVGHAAPLMFCFDVALDKTGFNGGRIGLDWRLPPPWYVETSGHACNAHLYVPAGQTNDGIARNFYCDKPAGHPAPDPTAGKHRMVYDNDNDPEGTAFLWPISHDNFAPRFDGSTRGLRATSTASKEKTDDTGSASDD